MASSRSNFRRRDIQTRGQAGPAARAGGAGRAGRAAFGQFRDNVSQLPKGELIDSLDLDGLDSRPDDRNVVGISNTTLLTSFNWLGGTTNAAILIPGMPPKWTPPFGITKLSPDSGTYFRDQNAARFPNHPMEPTALAILKARPTKQVDIDVLACGNTIGSLLRFASGQGKSFRMLVELIGGTVFLVRRERSPTEIIPDVVGFGHSFLEANTTWDSSVKQSESHQRILHYDFGGLKIALRYEGDAYAEHGSSSVRTAKAPASKQHTEGDGVAELVATIARETFPSNTASTGDKTVRVREFGHIVSQQNMLDIKTRSIRRQHEDTLAEELPRLWARQIPQFLLAHHTTGRFSPATVRDVRDDVRQWETEHQSELAILSAVLHKIVDWAHQIPAGKFELHFDGGSRLEVRAQLKDVSAALSDDVQRAWIEAFPSDGVNLPIVEARDEKSVLGKLPDILAWDPDGDVDYTACGQYCGYCGKCTY